MWEVKNTLVTNVTEVFQEEWMADLYYIYLKDVKTEEEFKILSKKFETAFQQNSTFDALSGTFTRNRKAMEDFVFSV
jgi:hypothetical protein